MLQSRQNAQVPLFAEWLMQERQRCERYNYFFSVVMLTSPKLSAWEIVNRISGSLRKSDDLGTVDGKGRYRCLGSSRELAREGQAQPQRQEMVGIVLTQTDRNGALRAVERLSAALSGQEQVRIGMAVYPDDSTIPEELMAIAAGGLTGGGAQQPA